MDWLVVILVVTALAMIGVISLIHRGRVRIWSICMILLGLGIGILLYTQISIFKDWQTALYIVFSVVLALVLVYLFVTLGTRRQQKSAKLEKNPEEGDVLATASREPMRLSEWEAVISYSAAPAKASKDIHRVNANKPPDDPAPVSFSSVAFTASVQADAEKTEQEELAANAITSFFRENTQMPASAIRMDAAVHQKSANGKAEERKPYPEPLRVSSAAKPIAEPAAEKENDEAFESLSFRVVRDKSSDSQKKPEPSIEPKSAVTKDAPAAEKEKDASSSLYKVRKKAPAVAQNTPDALDIAPEQDGLVSPVPLTPVEEPQAAQLAASEPLAEVQAEEPEESIPPSPAALELAEEPVPVAQVQPAVEVPEPAQHTEPMKEPEPVEEAELVQEEAPPVAVEIPSQGVSEPEVEPETEFDTEPEVEPLAAEIALPVAEESEPVPEQQNALQAQFEAGMIGLNALTAAKEYRNAQALIFDLLRMEYEPTEEEKRRLLLVMKLLKEKEKTNADARNR